MSDKYTFFFNLPKFGCLWDLHGERWGRGWEELNKPLWKIDLWGGVCLMSSPESYTCISRLVFLLQFLKPAAEDFVKRTSCRKVDPGKQSGRGSGFFCPSPLHAGQAEGIQRFQMFCSVGHCWLWGSSRGCSTSGFLWLLRLKFIPKEGKQTKNSYRKI